MNDGTPSREGIRDRQGFPNGQSSTPHQTVEIELKLTAAREDLLALWDSDALLGPGVQPLPPVDIVNTYYDTPERRLRRRGVTFRVRAREGRFLQTVKLADAGSAALRERPEWEAPIASAVPEPERIDDPVFRDQLGRLPAELLEPVFETKYRRAVKIITIVGPDGRPTIIEAALDIGRIEAGDREEPIAEIEFELVKGAAAALFDLAKRLHAERPVRVEIQGKAARGHRLATGERPAWIKGRKVDLPPRITVDNAIGRVVALCVEHWLANEAATVDGRDPEGVHQMRVALRRLRSAVSLFGHALPAEQGDWLGGEAKWLANTLGPARDWDVFAAELLAPVLDMRPEDDGLKRLAAATEAARVEAYEAVRQTIGGPRYTTFVLELVAWLERRGWRLAATDRARRALDETVDDLARRELGRRHHKVEKRGRRFESLSTEKLHELRIAVKKLRYGVEFFAKTFGGAKGKRYREALSGLQNSLGHLNDIATAERLLAEALRRVPTNRRRPVERAAALVLGWHLGRQANVRSEAAAGWQALSAAKPFWLGKPRARATD